jgi:hypothetical protein
MTSALDAEWGEFSDHPPASVYVIPRLWPIVVGSIFTFGSLFLPWIILGRSTGNQEPLAPSDNFWLLTFGGLLCVSLAFFGLIQWRQKAPRKPILAAIDFAFRVKSSTRRILNFSTASALGSCRKKPRPLGRAEQGHASLNASPLQAQPGV